MIKMNRNIAFDIARGISMLYIIGYWHLLGYTDYIERFFLGDYVKNASLGLFFLISGYLLAIKYAIINKKQLIDFLKRRFLRIIPLFLVALLSYYIVGFNTLKVTVLALFGFSPFWGSQPPTLWFVSMIIVFYYFFCFLSGRRAKYQLWLSLLLFIVLYILILNFDSIDRRLIYYWPCFSIGMLLKQKKIDEIFSSKLIAFISLILLFFSVFVHRYIYTDMLLRSFVSLFGAFVILYVAFFLSRFSKIHKFFNIISFLSMSAYLFHRQIIDVLEKYIFWPSDGPLRLVYLVFICLPVVLTCGYVIQKIYNLVIGLIINRFEK